MAVLLDWGSATMSGDDDMPEPELGGPHHGMLSPGLERAVKLAREVLKERGLSDEEIDRELGKIPQPRSKKDPPM